MFCQKCGSQLSDGAAFCSSCGSKVPNDRPSQPQPKFDASPFISKPETTTNYVEVKKERKKFGCLNIFLGFLVLVFVTSFLGGVIRSINSTTSESPSPSETTTSSQDSLKPPKPESLLDALGLTQSEFSSSLTKGCSVLSKSFKSSSLAIKTKSRLDGMKSVSDAFEAQDFVNDREWVSVILQDQSVQSIESSIAVDFRKALAQSKTVGASTLESDYPSVFSAFLSEYTSESLDSCDLSGDFQSFKELKSQAQRLTSLAANAPWYPKGFTEYADGLTAWKWADRSCSYYSGRCNHIDVVSSIGCSSLYVEVNFLDSGESVVDWSNDTARGLAPGQTAKLEFVTFGDSVSSAQLVDISCY